MEEKLLFKTQCQIEREARDIAIFREYKALMEINGQSKMGAKDFLMKKYGIHSQATIYVILNRVEQRLKQEEEGEQV